MKVFVESLQCRARHGVYDEERQDGREFVVDVSAEVELGDLDDRIDLALDYRDLARIVVEHMDGPSVHLVETLAHRILGNVLDLPGVQRGEITIRKRADGVPGDPEFVGISMSRSR